MKNIDKMSPEEIENYKIEILHKDISEQAKILIDIIDNQYEHIEFKDNQHEYDNFESDSDKQKKISNDNVVKFLRDKRFERTAIEVRYIMYGDKSLYDSQLKEYNNKLRLSKIESL